MKKLFDRDEIWFAVVWIVIYVVGFGNADALSEAVGLPKVFTACLGLALSGVLFSFIRRHGLMKYYGLCAFRGRFRHFLYFIPLAMITSVNLWHGVTLNESVAVSALYIVSMCCVGFLEEVIFRGFLFKGMSKSNVKAAMIVSSLTFGAGHIVNLVLGAPLLDTLLQLCYASAIGFCYTAVFHVGGSLLPCVVSHALVNATSVFAADISGGQKVWIAAVQIIVSAGYGAWLLYNGKREA